MVLTCACSSFASASLERAPRRRRARVASRSASSSRSRSRSFSSPAAFSVNVTATIVDRSVVVPCREHVDDAIDETVVLPVPAAASTAQRLVERVDDHLARSGVDRRVRVAIIGRHRHPPSAMRSPSASWRLVGGSALFVRAADGAKVAQAAGALARRAGSEARLDRAIDDLQHFQPPAVAPSRRARRVRREAAGGREVEQRALDTVRPNTCSTTMP